MKVGEMVTYPKSQYSSVCVTTGRLRYQIGGRWSVSRKDRYVEVKRLA